LVSDDNMAQSLPISTQEFLLWYSILDEIDGIGFYNTNTYSGSSQPHRHLQIVPTDSLWSLRSSDALRATALDDLILAQKESHTWQIASYSSVLRQEESVRQKVYRIPQYDFQHAIVLLDSEAYSHSSDPTARYDHQYSYAGILYPRCSSYS
jgi:hypothetical protein